MIDLITFRQLLGPSADVLSDDEVERVRAIEYGIADAIFESWLRKRNAQAVERQKAAQAL